MAVKAPKVLPIDTQTARALDRFFACRDPESDNLWALSFEWGVC